MKDYLSKLVSDGVAVVSESERPWLTSKPLDAITALSQDIVFCSDVRNALTMLHEPDGDILAESETDRTLDLARALIALRSLDRESLTQLLLDHSLCPLHTCDYAICFDDDDAECAAIRTIHPSHDT